MFKLNINVLTLLFIKLFCNIFDVLIITYDEHFINDLIVLSLKHNEFHYLKIKSNLYARISLFHFPIERHTIGKIKTAYYRDDKKKKYTRKRPSCGIIFRKPQVINETIKTPIAANCFLRCGQKTTIDRIYCVIRLTLL